MTQVQINCTRYHNITPLIQAYNNGMSDIQVSLTPAIVQQTLICVAVVVEWLACLPVTQKIGVRFYLERESSTMSGWINVGREWCCRGWSIEGGTPGGLFRTRNGLPRIRKARAARNVHECESMCAWNKNIVSAPKWLPCMNACMWAVFHCICICMCSN